MKFRRLWAAALASALLLCSGCGSDKGQESSPAPVQTPEASAPAVSQSPQETEEETEQWEEVEDWEEEQPAPMNAMIRPGGMNWVDEQGQEMCAANWETVILDPATAEAWPALATALESDANNCEIAAQEFIKNNLAIAMEAAEEFGEDFYGFVNEETLSITRADSRIFSVLADGYEYTGGVHPMSMYRAINLDPATGADIGLEQVMPGWQQLAQLLPQLLQQAHEGMDFWNLEEQLAGYEAGNYVWTMGATGVTIHFAPYEIAPYAAGSFHVHLDFWQNRELFHDDYVYLPQGGYTVPLPPHTMVEHDLDGGDGIVDRISTYHGMTNQEGVLCFGLQLNEDSFLDESCTGTEFMAYLVSPADDSSYVLVYALDGQGGGACYTYPIFDYLLGQEMGAGTRHPEGDLSYDPAQGVPVLLTPPALETED